MLAPKDNGTERTPSTIIVGEEMKRRGITRRLHPERGLNDAANSFSSSPSPSLKALSRLVQTTIPGGIPGAPAPAVTNGWMDTAAFSDLWHDVCSRICRGRQPSHSVEPRFVEDLITHLALQPEDVFYVYGAGTVRAPSTPIKRRIQKIDFHLKISRL